MPWHAKASGGYAFVSTAARDNGRLIYQTLGSRGWTLHAVCGLLGNMGAESGYNPWRWQSDKIGSSGGSPWRNKGYGFVQFTPASKYINAASAKVTPGYGPNFSNVEGRVTDGYAQLIFIDEHADYYATSAYPLNYAEFKISTESPAYLASAWLYNYERPADPGATENTRRNMALAWYEYLSGEEPPDPPDPPDPPPTPGPARVWSAGPATPIPAIAGFMQNNR